MKTWKILTIFTVLVLSLFIGCSDMIDTMARIELTVTIDDHNIPLDSAFTLHATREGSSDQISKTLGSVATDVTLIELQSGTWTLRVQARADGVLIGEGEVSVTTKPGTAIPATINMVYQYAVTFDAASGTASLPGKDVVYADTYGTLPTASRIGYAFDGWYTGLNGTGTEVDETTTVSTTTNHTLHAKWTPLRYDITYALNSGTNNASNPSSYTIETTDIILAAPTRTGYSFGGWFADSTFAGSAVPSILQGATGAKTLYAKWNPLSYDITYVLNSGTNNASNPSTYTIEATDIILAAPTRTGYTFDGWFADSTFTGSAVPSIPQGSTGAKTLHAKWMANSNLAIFDKQEGTGGTVSVSATYDAVMPGAMAPTRAGFSFGGYYDREGGGGNQYYTDAMASMRSWDKTAETTLYAKWTSLVTYDSQGATTAADPTAKTVIYTSGIDTVGLLPTPPQRTGYTFGGWWTATSGNGTEFTATTPVNGNITVYAKWIANTYAVTYDGNGATDGSVPGTGITKTHDIDLVIHGNTGNLVRTGYAFSGWNTLSGGSGTDYAVNSTYVVNAAVTLYAKWTPNTNTAYTVEHYLQDVSGSTYTLSDTENKTGTTTATVSATAKSYTGFAENTSHTSKVDSGTVAGDGTLVLRLYYDRNTFTVSFVENEGSDVSDLTGVRYSAKIAAPPIPARTGYGFGGWYKELSLTTAWSFTSDTVTSSTQLYAKWNPHSNTKYKVEHYQQDVLGSGYTKSETVSMIGTTATMVDAVAKSYAGFAENTSHASRVASGTIAADGTLVLKLYYDRNTYTVRFAENNGSNVSDLTGVRHGATITAPTDPIRTGYDFGGWCKNAILTTAWMFDSDMVVADTTLYAKWSPSTNTAYKVEHYQQDVSGSTYSLKDTENKTGTTAKTVDAVAKSYTGFTENTSHASRVASGTVAGDGTLVLRLYYNRNTFTVSFVENEGSDVSDLTGVRYSAKITAPTIFTRTGYDFGGWYKESSLNNAWSFASDVVTSALTLYAKWSPSTNTAYKVEHYQQDVSGSTYSLKDTENKTGTTAKTVDAVAKSYTGFTENTGHASRVASGTVAADGTLVLRLYYDRNTYSVNFIENEGSAVSDLTAVRYGSTIAAPTAPTRTGYDFGGWYKESSLTNAWSFASDTVTSSIQLYAKWNPHSNTTYKVEHYQQDVSGISYSLKDTENKVGTTAETVTAIAKSYTGFTENTSHTFRIASGTVAGDGTLVLRLYYNRNTYSVTFIENEGSAVSDLTGFLYGATIAAPPIPARTGYTFGGWYKESSLATTWTFGSDAVVADTTLYAKWQALVVGGIGPAGGYIFYAKESYSDGWRYLEAAPSDIVPSGTNHGHVFGYYRTTPTGANQGTGATGTAIGTGKANTASLVGSMGAAAYTESSGTTTTSDYAAKLTDDYTITNGGVTYSDWFLPSKDELNQMYLNLKVSNLVNFSSDTYNEYWTSSEYDSGYAMYQSFDNGYQGYIYRGSMGHRVRPVRAF